MKSREVKRMKSRGVKGMSRAVKSMMKSSEVKRMKRRGLKRMKN